MTTSASAGLVELDEATLVARARNRDPAAFEMLVRRYQRRIYSLCLRMLNGASGDAAQAARAVPGVVRLQPGVLGLLRQFAAQTWTQATGKALPDIGGVDVDLSSDREQLRIELRIVVSIRHHAAGVGQAVHDAVTEAAAAVTDKPAQIEVHIVEIELEPGRRVQP